MGELKTGESERADSTAERSADLVDSARAPAAFDVNERRLFPEDQAKVDEFLSRGVNSVDRKPFRPMFLILLLIAVVTGFSLLSQTIANWAGVY